MIRLREIGELQLDRLRAGSRIFGEDELKVLKGFSEALTLDYYKLWAGLGAGFSAFHEFGDMLGELYSSLRKRLEGVDLRELSFLDRALLLEAASSIAESLSRPHQETLAVEMYRPSIWYKGRKVSLMEAVALMVEEDEPVERERLEDAVRERYSELAPLKLKVWEVNYTTFTELTGVGSYLEAVGILKGIDYRSLFEELLKGLKKLLEVYREVFEVMVEPISHLLERRPVRKAHFLWLSKFKDLQVSWSAEGVLRLVLPSPDIPASLTFDLEDRENKSPRAACFPIKPGRDVRLLVRPSKGFDDVLAFLHELGHGLNYAHIRASQLLRYELNSDPELIDWLASLSLGGALTETYAFLFQYHLIDQGNEEKVRELNPAITPEDLKRIWTYELYLFIRYVSKLEVELSWHDALSPYENLEGAQRTYSETLTSRLGVKFSPEEMVFDLDPHLYSADYLVAWLTERTISRAKPWDELVGSVLVPMWERGNLLSILELIAALTGWGGSFRELVENLVGFYLRRLK